MDSRLRNGTSTRAGLPVILEACRARNWKEREGRNEGKGEGGTEGKGEGGRE